MNKKGYWDGYANEEDVSITETRIKDDLISKKITETKEKELSEADKEVIKGYAEEERKEQLFLRMKFKDIYPDRTTADDIRNVYTGMADLIDEKNKRYGNSVMEPLGIFNSYVSENNDESLNGILIRLDDKLKRIKNSEELRKNDVSDLMGYLAFLCVNKDWTDFSDLID